MLNNYLIKRENETIPKLALFFLFPFFTFIYCLRRPTTKSSYIIFFLFGMLYAWMMDTHIEHLDFYRIVNDFYNEQLTLDELLKEINLFFNGESHYKEVYKIILNCLTHQFTDNYHALFLISSVPFLYFMLKSLKYITHDILRFDNSIYSLVVILLFLVPFDLFQLSNFRFPTAAWMCIYALIKIFYQKDIKYFLLILMATLIHSGAWGILLLSMIFYVAPINLSLLIRLFYLSIPFAFIQTNILSHLNFDFLPQQFAHWGNSYLSEDIITQFGMYRAGSGFYWVEILARKLTILSYHIGIIIIIKDKKFITDNYTQNLLHFIIFLFTIVNFIQIIPTLGERYLRITEVLFILLWFKLYSRTNKRKYLYCILCASTYIIFYEKILYYLMTLEPDFFFMNFFSLIIKNYGVNIY